MTSQIGKQLQNTYCPISQAVKTTRHWKYKMRNIFLEKSYTKCSGEASFKSFSKKSNLCISLDQQSKVLYSLFLLSKSRPIEIYWK